MSSLDPVVIEPDLLRRITRREYRAMGRAGLFDDERVELLYGQLVVMTPPDPSHDASIYHLAKRLILQLGERAQVRQQSGFAASDDSEPLPDILVATDDDYWNEHPRRALLVVEVSRTSLRKDRGVKSRLYGEVDVAEYWIVDVNARCVHVLREPDGVGHWRSQQTKHLGETLTVAAFPDVTISVDDIVPPIT